MSMGIIASIQPLVSMQHLQWLASQHVASPQDTSLYSVMFRSFESCVRRSHSRIRTHAYLQQQVTQKKHPQIPRMNFETSKELSSAGTTMIRAFVDLTKRTLMSTTFDPRRPHCYVKCLGSFETHFTHNAFKSLLLPLVAFLLDCLSKGCPNASALKDWRTMRRT